MLRSFDWQNNELPCIPNFRSELDDVRSYESLSRFLKIYSWFNAVKNNTAEYYKISHLTSGTLYHLDVSVSNFHYKMLYRDAQCVQRAQTGRFLGKILSQRSIKKKKD